MYYMAYYLELWKVPSGRHLVALSIGASLITHSIYIYLQLRSITRNHTKHMW